MKAWLLGSGGWIPTDNRETMCVFLRHHEHGLLLDAGTGLRRLVSEPALLEGIRSLDIVLTHFHLDHVCGLAYVPALSVRPAIWAPGRWLYGRSSAELLAPLRTAPLSAFEAQELGDVHELRPATQSIGRFGITTREQTLHWAPTAGLRVQDALALITDTAYEAESAEFARGVTHLLHEAWSCSSSPVAQTGDATAAEAGHVAREARAAHLTLVHISPVVSDEAKLLADAQSQCPAAQLGQDGRELQLT
jgi:ribonuclease BN (tRNA processing enzyme)